MKTQTLKIDGMSCGHCVMTLKKELLKIEGVTVTNAGIGSAEITIDESKVTGLRLEEAVKEAGFLLVSMQ
jgi:copper chaperone